MIIYRQIKEPNQNQVAYSKHRKGYKMTQLDTIKKAGRVKNATLAKLTADEIGLFGLYELGICAYHGELKARRKGFKTTKENEYQTNYTTNNGGLRFEFIKIVDGYAARLYDIDNEEYRPEMQILWPIDFLK